MRRALVAVAVAVALGLGLVSGLVPEAARADAPDAGAAAPSPSTDASAYAEAPKPSCTEKIPDGVKRPFVSDTFPNRAESGYATRLTVVIHHGKGEVVLADGMRVARQGDAQKVIADAGFLLPDADGIAGPVATVEHGKDGATTTLIIPVVPVNKKAGQAELTLPPLPVVVQRAGGEFMILCTKSHKVRVHEPKSMIPAPGATADPPVRPNPPARPQKEEWVLLEQVLVGVGVGLALALVGLLVHRWWRRRPRVEVAKPRPIPWLVALAELDALRKSTLLAEHQNDVYFDQVSDTIRRYLGARYQFDTLEAGTSGVETTTDETKVLLRRVRPPVTKFGEICIFLDEADLVKFARVFPSDEDCVSALDRAEQIVRGTVPPGWQDVEQGAPPPPASRPSGGAS